MTLSATASLQPLPPTGTDTVATALLAPAALASARGSCTDDRAVTLLPLFEGAVVLSSCFSSAPKSVPSLLREGSAVEAAAIRFLASIDVDDSAVFALSLSALAADVVVSERCGAAAALSGLTPPLPPNEVNAAN